MSGTLRPGKAQKLKPANTPQLVTLNRSMRNGRATVVQTVVQPGSSSGSQTPAVPVVEQTTSQAPVDPEAMENLFGMEMGPNDHIYDDTERSRTKNQNDYLREFERRKHSFVQVLLERYAGPDSGLCMHCPNQEHAGQAVFRCRTCFGAAAMCRGCMRSKHFDTPFHRIERWNGLFYQRASLWQCGLHLVLQSRTGCDCIARNLGRVEAVERQEDQYVEPPEFGRQRTGLGASFSGDPADGYRMHRGSASTAPGPQHPDAMASADESPTPAPPTAHERHNPGHHVAEDVLDYIPEGDEAVMPDPTEDLEDPGDDEDFEDDTGDRLGAGIPLEDSLQNRYITVVDSTGIHHLPVIACLCYGPERTVLDYISVGLLPASYSQVSTVFTERCLDEARLSNLEAKTTPYQYFNYLRRLTNPAFPGLVANRYTELRRLLREWRIMKREMWAATHMEHPPSSAGATPPPAASAASPASGRTAPPPGLNSTLLDSTGAGKISLFCPACPQPGVNLPDNWQATPDDQKFVYRPSLATDANFSADHIKQRKIHDDVHLLAGRGMFTPAEPYGAACRAANARKEPRNPEACGNNFRAIAQSAMTRSDCDVTGIGAVACARHGHFVPGSVVNLQKGERHCNMDWSVIEAFWYANIGPDATIYLWYDIFCQWSINFFQRVRESNGALVLPPGICVCGGIGLFHVHGHEEKCFRRYASYFIPGAAIVDGEVVETLWSVLNMVSRSTRTATLAHREEVIDDHMNDSNWKKLTGTVSRLVKKYKTAQKEQAETSEYFDNMTKTAPAGRVPTWIREITAAENLRQSTKCLSMDVLKPRTATNVETQADAQLRMIGRFPHNTDGAAYIAEGLKLEIEQLQLGIHIGHFGKYPAPKDRVTIAELRAALMKKLNKLHERSAEILGLTAAAAFEPTRPPIPVFHADQEDGVFVENADESRPTGEGPQYAAAFESSLSTTAERVLVRLPSALPAARLPPTTPGAAVSPAMQNLANLVEIEKALRLGLTNDTLQDLRVAISSMSFQYTEVYRKQSTKMPKTRSRTAIDNLAKGISHSRRVYDLSRQRLAVLGVNNLRPITNEDVKVSTSIRDPNAPGHVRSKLSWIFQVEIFGTEGSDVEVMSEYFRIHWLYARAMKMRWDEEAILVPHEMVWTSLYFERKAAEWWKVARHATSLKYAGQAAYASGQAALWRRLAAHAKREFAAVLPAGAQLPSAA